ncbi:hypothetical protein GGI12_003016 [Dipsacomyces acuminosporus]|nr:hypothetical protein GGI12_003016 [Dipsacomyces acuminosporus]
MTIVIGSNYGYTVLAAVGIALQAFLTGTAVFRARKKYNVPYPDNGGGRYSDKLSEEDWLKFNNIKRVSDNYLEQAGLVLTVLLASGLYHPKFSGALGGIYILGRIIYGQGYTAKGPKGRVYGAGLMISAFFAMSITAGYSAAITTFLA